MNNKKLIIIGAGGHGRVAYDIAKRNGYKEIYFLDDGDVTDSRVVGKSCDIEKYIKDSHFFVAIGNGNIRRQITERLLDCSAEIVSLIAPSAVISDTVKIGKGSILMEGVVVNTTTIIGEGAIINTCASVDHDCIVGDFSHVSVGAHLCGTVNIGKGVWIGAGAMVINNISVCDDCIIGAGAVVVKDITAAGTYKGVPAK